MTRTGRIVISLAALTSLLGAFMPASAQTLPHWVDRQVHGTARHVTPRHHKPDEPPYPGEEGYPERFNHRRHVVTTTTTTTVRHHRRRRHHHRIRTVTTTTTVRRHVHRGY